MRPFSKKMYPKLLRCVTERQPVFLPMASSCNTSGRLASLREPLMAIGCLVCHPEEHGVEGRQPEEGCHFSSSIIRVDASDHSQTTFSSSRKNVSAAARTTTGVEGLEAAGIRSEEHTSELQSHVNLVCRLLL